MAIAIKEQEIMQVKQEIEQFIATVPMVVTNAEESSKAKLAVVTVRKEAKRRKEWFTENILCHAEKAYKQAKASFDAQKAVLADLLKPFTEWDQQTNGNILVWEQRERNRIKKEQDAENEKYARRVAAAIEKGKEPESVKPMKLVEQPVKTQKSEVGGYTLRVEKELVVFDETKIPGYEFMIRLGPYWKTELNRKALEAALRGGAEVPGALLQERLGSAVGTV